MLLSLISTLVAVHFTSADYPCLCNYHVEKEMYQKPDIHAQPSGYLYEFDCKAIIQRPFPGLNSSWIAIAHEHAVSIRGYFSVLFGLANVGAQLLHFYTNLFKM